MRPRRFLVATLIFANFAIVASCAEASLIDGGGEVDLERVICPHGESQNEHPIVDDVAKDVSTTEVDSSDVSTSELSICPSELPIGNLASVAAVSLYRFLFSNPPPLQRLKPPQANSSV